MPETHERSAPAGTAQRSPTAQTAGPPLKIESERGGNTYVVRLSGEMDIATAPAVTEKLAAALKSDYEMIVLDMGGLTFMDSAGISAVLSAEAASRADSNRLFFLRGSPSVERVLALCGADSQLTYLD